MPQYYFVLQSLHKRKFLHKNVFIERNFLVHTDNRNCSPKTDWISAPKQKKNTILKHVFKRIRKEISSAKI